MIRAVTLRKERATAIARWDALAEVRTRGELHWLDISGAADEDLERLRDLYDFHALAIEDCRNLAQRAKVKEYDGFSFMVAPVVQANGSRASASELDLFIGPNYLVTVHREPLPAIDKLFAVESRSGDSLRRGADFLFYQVLDALIDEYFPALDRIDARIAFVEREIFAGDGQRVLDSLLRLKREVLYLRRLFGPMREAVSALARRDFPFIRPESRAYFQALYDHMIHLFDVVDTQRELLSSAMEAHLSNVSNRLNEVMKVLTIIATIMMPLTVVTGFYGMNFKYMPELNWRYGPLWALGLMAAVTVIMLVYFRRRGWL